MKRVVVWIGVYVLVGCGDSSEATGGGGGPGNMEGGGGFDLSVWSCTEQGVRDAITVGGGPHTFACDGPTVVTTEAFIEIDNDVILDGEGNLTLDGNQDHPVLVLADPVRRTVVLRNMTITHGFAEGVGGGIFNSGSDLRIEGCSIVENESAGGGGGIYSFGGRLEVTGSTVSRNRARHGGGLLSGGETIIIETSITDNLGGGIDNAGRLDVLDSIINGNSATFGGGGMFNSGQLLVIRSIVSDNESDSGGGILSAGGLQVTQTTIDGNTAEEGGAIYAADGARFGGDLALAELGVLDVRFSTISNNNAERGAGIYGIPLRMAIWNSTLSGNTAGEEGGALYVGPTTLGDSTVFLTHNTIADNSAPVGSALAVSSDTPTLRLAGNLIVGQCIAETDARFDSRGYNIESPGQTCGLIAQGDVPNATTEQLGLGPLQDNGRDTETHLPEAGSLAIDLIPAEACADVLPVNPPFDQRAVSRPQGLGCDAGAVEASTFR